MIVFPHFNHIRQFFMQVTNEDGLVASSLILILHYLFLISSVIFIFVKTPSISNPSTILSSPIEYLTGVSAIRGDLLRKELNIFTFGDLLEHYPLRHIDRTKVEKINHLNEYSDYAQVAGKLIGKQIIGERRGRRLVAQLKDDTGIIELVWFQGIQWVEKILHTDKDYLVYGKLSFFLGKPQMAHPDIEPYTCL
ncbi:MAG: hypothetical protein FGM46_10540, partial [Ferruginibacter sp.]|nr:hypothetical protein [Ferruginibacter sp.]